MKILLIDNYDSFTYNLFHYISKLKCKVDVIRNDKIGSKEIIKKKYNKIVISPGPGNPSQAGNCLKIVKDLHQNLPILGVCLGHQIIGQVFGGKIVRAKNLMHGKMSKISITAETKNKTIMGIMHDQYDVHGVQFHPESINTKVGMQLIENFIKL